MPKEKDLDEKDLGEKLAALVDDGDDVVSVEGVDTEIEDEYDTDEMTDKKISDNEYLFSGRLEIDYINEKYNLNLPEADDYETLAGLIISYYESIPEKGNVIKIYPFLFTITEVSDTRIEQVNLKIID